MGARLPPTSCTCRPISGRVHRSPFRRAARAAGVAHDAHRVDVGIEATAPFPVARAARAERVGSPCAALPAARRAVRHGGGPSRDAHDDPRAARDSATSERRWRMAHPQHSRARPQERGSLAGCRRSAAGSARFQELRRSTPLDPASRVDVGLPASTRPPVARGDPGRRSLTSLAAGTARVAPSVDFIWNGIDDDVHDAPSAFGSSARRPGRPRIRLARPHEPREASAALPLGRRGIRDRRRGRGHRRGRPARRRPSVSSSVNAPRPPWSSRGDCLRRDPRPARRRRRRVQTSIGFETQGMTVFEAASLAPLPS